MMNCILSVTLFVFLVSLFPIFAVSASSPAFPSPPSLLLNLIDLSQPPQPTDAELAPLQTIVDAFLPDVKYGTGVDNSSLSAPQLKRGTVDSAAERDQQIAATQIFVDIPLEYNYIFTNATTNQQSSRFCQYCSRNNDENRQLLTLQYTSYNSTVNSTLNITLPHHTINISMENIMNCWAIWDDACVYHTSQHALITSRLLSYKSLYSLPSTTTIVHIRLRHFYNCTMCTSYLEKFPFLNHAQQPPFMLEQWLLSSDGHVLMLIFSHPLQRASPSRYLAASSIFPGSMAAHFDLDSTSGVWFNQSVLLFYVDDETSILNNTRPPLTLVTPSPFSLLNLPNYAPQLSAQAQNGLVVRDVEELVTFNPLLIEEDTSSETGSTKANVTFEYVLFSLNYDINSLPANFNFNLLKDIAKALNCPIFRLSIEKLYAGSVNVVLGVSSTTSSSSPSASSLASNLQSQVNNPNSALYTGGITNRAIAGSAQRISSPSAIPSSSNDDAKKLGLGLGIGLGGGLLLLIALVFYVYHTSTHKKHIAPSEKVPVEGQKYHTNAAAVEMAPPAQPRQFAANTVKIHVPTHHSASVSPSPSPQPLPLLTHFNITPDGRQTPAIDTPQDSARANVSQTPGGPQTVTFHVNSKFDLEGQD